MQKLKYSSYSVVFQEVPNEISLVINISGCPHKCEGCHSQYLWEYTGKYISDDLQKLISQYQGMITCICFMGGDQNIEELNTLLSYVKSLGLKTCVYSGLDTYNRFNLSLLDYLKIGKYIEKLGGLNNSTTNQKFYKILNNEMLDETYLFKRRL